MNSKHIHRKVFLQYLTLGAGAQLLVWPALLRGQQKKIEKGPPLDAALVKEFVTKGHGDLKRTEELLIEQPALLHASWDWGGGDFETALEGASHVGNKEIAHFLLKKGSRMTLFTVAMLGKLDLLKTALTLFPEQLYALGPHKLDLMHHAKKGGEDALPVVDYLKSLGMKEK